MIDCVYYNDNIRCFRDGRVERLNKIFKPSKWKEVENTTFHNRYNSININYKPILRHRIIAFCFLGLDDIVGMKNNDNCIDHINGDRLDNRVANLRITTLQGNQHNQTRAKGYSWSKHAKKWKAYITLNKKKIYLGSYNTEEEARQSYLTAKLKYHIH
jgi:hypothetical protein